MSTLWLNDRRKNVYSQNGEDGVIEAIFEKINAANRWCCEFGAGDGLEFSNTANLVKRCSPAWNGVMIESDGGRFEKIATNVPEIRYGMRRHVGLHVDKLDTILMETDIPARFDLLSIDVDGVDLQIWRTLSRYVPRVVIIEVDSLQAPGAGPSSRGMATLDDVVELGWEKGYELVLHTGNAIFVRSDEAEKLGVEREAWRELFDRRWIA